ncbi:MAG: hypothetical protein FWD25_07855 [Clostridia bacterium]|nr:hypothetical protein [Clostridia bacterium]
MRNLVKKMKESVLFQFDLLKLERHYDFPIVNYQGYLKRYPMLHYLFLLICAVIFPAILFSAAYYEPAIFIMMTYFFALPLLLMAIAKFRGNSTMMMISIFLCLVSTLALVVVSKYVPIPRSNMISNQFILWGRYFALILAFFILRLALEVFDINRKAIEFALNLGRLLLLFLENAREYTRLPVLNE